MLPIGIFVVHICNNVCTSLFLISFFLQFIKKVASEEEKAMVFFEVMPFALEHLVSDVFGNYVVQKLLEHGASDQKFELVAILQGHAVSLSMEMYGCRVIQKALEVISDLSLSLSVL